MSFLSILSSIYWVSRMLTGLKAQGSSHLCLAFGSICRSKGGEGRGEEEREKERKGGERAEGGVLTSLEAGYVLYPTSLILGCILAVFSQSVNSDVSSFVHLHSIYQGTHGRICINMCIQKNQQIAWALTRVSNELLPSYNYVYKPNENNITTSFQKPLNFNLTN